MKNKKNIYLFSLVILVAVFTISIPKSFSYAKERTYNKKNQIAAIKDKKIYLYYDKKTKNGMLEGFYLKSGDNIKYFNWESIDKKGFYPTIILINPTISLKNDDYIAVVCTLGEGSGVDIKKLYLINKKTLKELTYKDPLDVAEANVTSDIQAPNVTIKVGNNIFSSAYPIVKDFSNFNDKLGIGSMIKYDIQDSYFNVTLSAQVTPGLFIGEVKITYLWEEKKKKFIPEKINFSFYDTEID